MKHRDRKKAWRAANPEKTRKSVWVAAIKRQYGITEIEYLRMLAAQGGVCAICRGPQRKGRDNVRRLDVDHDHETGAVRGLLCRPCNTMIGLLDDDPNRAFAAATYLLRTARAIQEGEVGQTPS